MAFHTMQFKVAYTPVSIHLAFEDSLSLTEFRDLAARRLATEILYYYPGFVVPWDELKIVLANNQALGETGPAVPLDDRVTLWQQYGSNALSSLYFYVVLPARGTSRRVVCPLCETPGRPVGQSYMCAHVFCADCSAGRMDGGNYCLYCRSPPLPY